MENASLVEVAMDWQKIQIKELVPGLKVLTLRQDCGERIYQLVMSNSSNKWTDLKLMLLPSTKNLDQVWLSLGTSAKYDTPEELVKSKELELMTYNIFVKFKDARLEQPNRIELPANLLDDNIHP